MKTSQAGTPGASGQLAGSLHDGSSCSKLTIYWFGSRYPTLRADTSPIPTRQEQVLGLDGCEVIYEKSCTAEPQARPGKGVVKSIIIAGKGVSSSKVFTSTCCGPPVCNTCSGLLGRGDKVMWGCWLCNTLGCAKNFWGLPLLGGCHPSPSIDGHLRRSLIIKNLSRTAQFPLHSAL